MSVGFTGFITHTDCQLTVKGAFGTLLDCRIPGRDAWNIFFTGDFIQGLVRKYLSGTQPLPNDLRGYTIDAKKNSANHRQGGMS